MLKFRRNTPTPGGKLSDESAPAVLPAYGQGLNHFVTADYKVGSMASLGQYYSGCATALEDLLSTCDAFSAPTVCDSYLDAQMEHLYAEHGVEMAIHEAQARKIKAARSTRQAALEREKEELEKKQQELQAEIEPLKGLRSHWTVGGVSIGTVATLLAVIFDSFVNYSYLQTVLLSNRYLLIVSVVILALMSDVSMMILGRLISSKEDDYISRPYYLLGCVSMAGLFLLSVVVSVMVRFGSMDSTFGSINAAGTFVGKDSYSMAEQGVTLGTAFATAATGLISFVLSLDRNAEAVSRRDTLEKELSRTNGRLTLLCAELSDLESAADPALLDGEMCKAAEENLRALALGLKLHVRKLLAAKQGDSDFTDRVTASADALLPSHEEEDEVYEINHCA